MTLHLLSVLSRKKSSIVQFFKSNCHTRLSLIAQHEQVKNGIKKGVGKLYLLKIHTCESSTMDKKQPKSRLHYSSSSFILYFAFYLLCIFRNICNCVIVALFIRNNNNHRKIKWEAIVLLKKRRRRIFDGFHRLSYNAIRFHYLLKVAQRIHLYTCVFTVQVKKK